MHLKEENNMINKHIVLKALLTSFVLTSPVCVLASEAAFKVAVIKKAIGSKGIIGGDYDTTINKLTSSNILKNTFENNTGLCVAYLKNKNVTKSETACTAAIKSTASMGVNKKVTYLKSLSYSNRGVARYLNEDISGAFDDLTTAILIDVNPVTKFNLALIKQTHFESNDSLANSLSD
jgi:hypothetical protein